MGGQGLGVLVTAFCGSPLGSATLYPLHMCLSQVPQRGVMIHLDHSSGHDSMSVPV